MEKLSLNGERKQAEAPAGGHDATALAAVCWAAGALLAQAPAPVSRLRVRFGSAAVDLEWPPAPAGSPPPPPPEAASPSATAAPAVDGDTGQVYVRAPMVGTFYHAPSPEAPAFVQVGDVVEPGQQVGIVEAMKLMNAVEAEQPGRVTEVLVDNGAGVEFDQPLVTIAPLATGDRADEEQQCSPPY